MALIVESGAIVTGANSYVSLVDAQGFMDERGLLYTLTEAHLLRAMDALEQVDWHGEKRLHTSALPWPRTGIYNREGYLLTHLEVPRGVINGQIWIAYYLATGVDLAARTTIPVRAESVGPISITYAIRAGERDTVTLFGLPNVRNSLADYWMMSGRIERA